MLNIIKSEYLIFKVRENLKIVINKINKLYTKLLSYKYILTCIS